MTKSTSDNIFIKGDEKLRERTFLLMPGVNAVLCGDSPYYNHEANGEIVPLSKCDSCALISDCPNYKKLRKSKTEAYKASGSRNFYRVNPEAL